MIKTHEALLLIITFFLSSAFCYGKVVDLNKSVPDSPTLSFSAVLTEGYQWDHNGTEFKTTAIPVSYVRSLYAAIASLEKENRQLGKDLKKSWSDNGTLAEGNRRLAEIIKFLKESLEESKVVTAWPTEGWVFYEPFGWVYFSNEVFPYFWVTEPDFKRQFSMVAADIGVHGNTETPKFTSGLSGWCFLDKSSDDVLVYCFDKESWYSF